MRSLLIIPLLFTLLAAAAWAQEGRAPEAVVGGLTFAEALEIARENNPDYRIAEAEMANLPALERSAWWAFVPTLSLSMSTNYSQSRSFTALDDFNRPVRVDDPVVTSSSGSRQSLAWGQITLFDGGRIFAQARANQARAVGTRASVAGADMSLRTRLAAAYQAVLAAEREVELNERTLASAREVLEGTRRLLSVGVADPLQLLEAEIQVAQREHALETARGAARTARLELGNLMGIGREVTERLIDDLVAAFESSPAIAAEEASAAAAAHELTAARGSRWPQMSLGFSSGRGVSARGSDALFDMNPLDQSYSFSLSFSIPLYNPSVSDAITRARVNRLVAEERLRARRLQLEGQIRRGVIDLQNAYRNIQLAERTAEIARRRLELATGKYRLGTSSIAEMRQASDEAFNEENRMLAARHAFVTSLLQLEETAGVPIR